jgi:ABC transporter with metal-binding/Fe-S-binding domain ATP-binding protein
MKAFALYTGGKDSTYSIKLALDNGINVDSVITFISENPYSYMFHTVNTRHTYLQALAMGLGHYLFKTKGEKEKELNDLRKAFQYMKRLGYEAVVAGAVASRYQRDRISKIAEDIGLEVITPLWMYNQEKLLWDLLKEGFSYIIVSVSAMGLEKRHIGWIIDDEDDVNEIIRISKEHGFNPSGEGGEYETFVLDTKFFRYRIKILEYNIDWFGDSGLLRIKKAILVDKNDR